MTNLATQITPAPGCNIEPPATDAAVLMLVQSEAQRKCDRSNTRAATIKIYQQKNSCVEKLFCYYGNKIKKKGWLLK